MSLANFGPWVYPGSAKGAPSQAFWIYHTNLLPGVLIWGTQISMIIAQVGIPVDEPSVVTASVYHAPNLGGILGVAVVSAAHPDISYVYLRPVIFQRNTLSSSTVVQATGIFINPNDAVPVCTVKSFPIGSAAYAPW
uniref:Uncharacterized protein n=1 Tax=Moniliophthora roreri TaxID=221103 RepID=A0A0W0G3E0_MONRR